MPPKRKLPRRGTAATGELNLEAASEDLIDAVTAEPLDAVKFIEVLSPDKTLRLYYNTSTLIRIAIDNGEFMQPPHFREPMIRSLQEKIEAIEGKKFHFESRDTIMRGDGPAQEGDVTVQHRHLYFEQIMDEFYLLSPAEVYVCPVCYEHYITTRFVPIQVQRGYHVMRLRNDRPVIDPLDALSQMISEYPSAAVAENAQDGSESSWDNILAHIVFRWAAQWKAHMESHHGISGINAIEYRLRDVLCSYYNDYNQRNEEKHEDEMRIHGSAKKKTALTIQRYWRLNASYNRLRYNRVVAAAEAAADHPEAVTSTSFPNETIAHHFNPEDEDEDDFIDDNNSSDSDLQCFPRYSPTEEGFEDEQKEDEVEPENGNHAAVPRAGKRKREHSVSSRSTSSATSHTSSSPSSSDSSYDAEVERQRSLFKRGLLAERDCYYSRLSAEDRHFFERSQKENVATSTLYDPRMHKLNFPISKEEDDIDWENIGEPLPTKSPLKVKLEVGSAPPAIHANSDPNYRTPRLDADVNSEAPRTSQRTRMLLDDDS